MDLIGIEPMTSSMPWKRAPSCATGPRAAGMQLPYCLRYGAIRQTAANQQELVREVSRSDAKRGGTSGRLEVADRER